MPDTCANCGQPLGKLETPFTWSGQTVCAPCYARLQQEAALRVGAIPYASVEGKRTGFPWIIAASAGLAIVILFALLFGLLTVSSSMPATATPAPLPIASPATSPASAPSDENAKAEERSH